MTNPIYSSDFTLLIVIYFYKSFLLTFYLVFKSAFGEGQKKKNLYFPIIQT